MDSKSAGKAVLVTGATGFIGRHLVARLLEEGASVKALVRTARVKDTARLWQGANLTQVVADLMGPDLPNHICDKVDTVFHLAGYAHAEDANDPRAANIHWRITVEATQALLAQAAHSGVRRFVFVSSVKAMGEGGDSMLDETSSSVPITAYGKAKCAAEKLVLAAGLAHGMHVCVLRLPLVYGPGSKGNLSRMISAIDRGRFPSIPDTGNRRRVRRSSIYRDGTSQSPSRTRNRRVDLLRRPRPPCGPANTAGPQWLDASRGEATADYAPSLRSPWRAAFDGACG